MPTLTNRFKTDASIGSLALQSGYVCMLVGGSLVREAVHALRGLMAAGVAPLRGAGAFVVARALAADPHLGFCCLGGIPLARGGRVDLLLFSRYLWVGSSQVQLAKDDTHTHTERERGATMVAFPSYTGPLSPADGALLMFAPDASLFNNTLVLGRHGHITRAFARLRSLCSSSSDELSCLVGRCCSRPRRAVWCQRKE